MLPHHRARRAGAHERGVENPRDHMLIYQGADQPVRRHRRHHAGQPGARSPPRDSRRSPSRPSELGFDAGPHADRGHRPALRRHSPRPAVPDDGVGQFDEDISPPTDNRPFFFQMADDRHLPQGGASATTSSPARCSCSASLALAVLLLAAVCIGLPAVPHARGRSRAQGDACRSTRTSPGSGSVPAHRDLAAATVEHLPRPPDLRARGGAVLRAAVQRHGQHARPSGSSTPERPQSLCVPLLALLGLVVRLRDLHARASSTPPRPTTPVRIARRRRDCSPRWPRHGHALLHRHARGRRPHRAPDRLPVGHQRRHVGVRVGVRRGHRPLLRDLAAFGAGLSPTSWRRRRSMVIVTGASRPAAGSASRRRQARRQGGGRGRVAPLAEEDAEPVLVTARCLGRPGRHSGRRRQRAGDRRVRRETVRRPTPRVLTGRHNRYPGPPTNSRPGLRPEPPPHTPPAGAARSRRRPASRTGRAGARATSGRWPNPATPRSSPPPSRRARGVRRPLRPPRHDAPPLPPTAGGA